MFKASLITLNLIALLAIKLIFGGDVSVEQKVPDSVNAGETFSIEVTINKGDREGFAKWQQKLPEGFIAKAKSSEGATFSFKNQDVKLIWMALPEKETITIIYDIETDPNLSGDFNIEGKFSFIEENDRKDITAEIKTIKVSSENILANSEDGVDSEDLVDNTNNDETIDETDTEELGDNVDNSETIASNTVSEGFEFVTYDEDINISRKVTHIENGEYLVELEIEKGAHNSFGKIEEYVPEGFIASSNENNSGIFSFNKNVVKILWMALPKKADFKVSYNLKSSSDLLDQVRLHGMFSYLKIDESVQLEMKASRFTNYYQPSEQLADESQKGDDEETISDNGESIEEKEVNSEETADNISEELESQEPVENLNEIVETPKETKDNSNQSSNSEEEMVREITSIPAAEASINYKVQIAAGRKKVKQDYFSKVHGITETVSIEYHENWYKYTLGSFSVYKQARDQRNRVWESDNKINDAFVTAYNAGERISVQEALMVTKQQWFK